MYCWQEKANVDLRIILIGEEDEEDKETLRWRDIFLSPRYSLPHTLQTYLIIVVSNISQPAVQPQQELFSGL